MMVYMYRVVHMYIDIYIYVYIYISEPRNRGSDLPCPPAIDYPDGPFRVWVQVEVSNGGPIRITLVAHGSQMGPMNM